MTSKRVVIIDTSMFCTWLKVPGKQSCGPDDDRWDYTRVAEQIDFEVQNGSTLVLPMATIIETGNHISQSVGDPYELAKRFCAIIEKSVKSDDPWAAFSHQNILWEDRHMLALASSWPQLASQRLSLGDATIKDVADLYARSQYNVVIFTGDKGLKAYEPSSERLIPRRRR